MKVQLLIIVVALQFVSSVQAVNNQEACFGYLESLFFAIINKKTPYLQINTIVDSGKSINDLGDFDHCNSLKVQKNADIQTYYLTTILKQSNPYVDRQHVGLCVPLFCSEQTLQNLLDTAQGKAIIQQLNTTTNNTLTSVILKKPPVVSDIFKIQTSLYFLILFPIILFNCIGCYTSYVRDQEKKKQLQQLQNQEFLIQQQSPPRLPKYLRFTSHFSLYDNYNKCFPDDKPKDSENNIGILKGIAAISIFWIILGSTFQIRTQSMKFSYDYFTFMKDGVFPFLAATSSLGIDILYFLGAFQIAYFIITNFNQEDQKFHGKAAAVMILRRLIRIWPLYIFIVLTYWLYFPLINDGPIWYQMVEETEVCKTSVWQNIFYVDNLVKHGENGKNYCLDVGWYISNEFMFYIFNIIAIYVYLKKPVLGWISALSILVISLGVTFSVASANSFKFNWPSEGFNQPYYFENFYIKPFTRMIPYAMGTILGFLYSQFKQNGGLLYAIKHAKIARFTILIFFLIGLILMWLVLYGAQILRLDQAKYSKSAHIVYLTFGTFGFIIGLIFVIIGPLISRQNIQNKVYSLSIWSPIAQASLCMFLVHRFVIQEDVFQVRTLDVFNNLTFFYNFVSDSVVVFIVAMIFHLGLELPLQNIEEALFTKRRREEKQQEIQEPLRVDF